MNNVSIPSSQSELESSEDSNLDVDVKIQYCNKINFASAQNRVTIIQDLRIANRSDKALEKISLTLSASPAVLRTKTWNIDRIAPQSEISLSNLETPLDTAILARLDEAEFGQLHFRTLENEQEIGLKTYPIELLARDEWGGLTQMDTMLAAFVSPNQPPIARVLKEAGRLLEAAGHPSAIDGYQKDDPQRVWMVAGAIWSAATGLGLTYAVPPASFERNGQKIRDPERVVSEGLATCLDSSLFLAAAFEAAGLNAAILFARGHAWAGVWLNKKDFGKLVEPDVVAVRKAVAAREFVALETTLLTSRPSVGFEQAAVIGRERLSEAHETDFEQAVDINRARAAQIRPLASRQDATTTQAENDIAPPTAAALPRALDLGMLPGDVLDTSPTTPIGRIERWQRKLLDLSLANRLLNFKETKLSVPLLCAEVSALEDNLANGKSFRLLALKDENAVAGRNLTPDETQAIERELARKAEASGQIAIPLTAKEMGNRLTEIYRKARSDLQEGGTNTLFLAVGFLRWQRTKSEERHFRAPLLLLPVKLERRSAQSEFRLSQLEDEVRFNATLLELLKRDFELRIPELEAELPHDESGLDIPRIFEIMRRRIHDVAGFEVVEECAISTFSFAKYLMWKDLVDRTDSLRASPMVRHLVDCPTEPFEGHQTAMPVASDMDRTCAPSDILAPMPADSSQLAAVVAAAQGRDFVLIGPPGTGKSQTITNIIADQLGRGKTVLFVAEKAAALDVVQRRLERQGLGSAVLELHSNKADRKSVLQQLGRSWERASGQSQTEWLKVTEDLRLSRDQLNDYVQAMHSPGSQGFSIYQAIGRAVSGPAPFQLAFDNKDCHDSQSYQHLRDLAAELAQRHGVVKHLDASGPLALLDSAEWSYHWQDSFLAQARQLRSALEQTQDALDKLARVFGCSTDTHETRAAFNCLALARLEQAAIAPAAITNLKHLQQAIPTLAESLKLAQAARKDLSAHYKDEVIASMPLEALELQWREAQTKVWPFDRMAKSKVRKLLQTYAAAGNVQPDTDIAALRRLLPLMQKITETPLAVLPGYAGEQTEISQLNAQLDAAEAFLELESQLNNAGIPAERLRTELCAKDAGTVGPLLKQWQSAKKNLTVEQRAFTDAGGQAIDDNQQAQALLAAMESQRFHFTDWLKWRSTRTRALAAGLLPLVEALESGSLEDDAVSSFERAYMLWWLPLALDASQALRSFVHWEHEALIRRFQELDQSMTDRVATEVMRRLGNKLPSRDSVPRKSELGILRHQLGLQRPTAAIRNLIAEMPTTFPALAPCLLMSPLSVAQYLPPGQALFDLVIFDEASQISTWDAIGAIARGRQAIIVGDPKQLPPTNFFGRSDDTQADNEDLQEVEKDMPSILDEVAVSGVPTHRLNWHYRSRDEALIAFSNHHYYDGELITFPSPDRGSQAVRLHQTAGTYQRGKARTNPDEARAIVRFITLRLKAWLRLAEDQRPTLGVITFNVQQQGLIDDLLDAERKADPTLEWFFSDEREEPLIVKNLENIQGDERDVMLFSITFGPDQSGRLSMNFGTLNNDGGEKRLNVAITRARTELHIFSSITADQIDLSRTGARGVKDFKAFLDFADRGAIALAAQDDGSMGPEESLFEVAVRAALQQKGWEVRTQIGVSGLRIDLGVVHPDLSGAWLAGVECDGATYHRAASARDRDRIRQAVLEGLGWKILRIWSTDWFRNPTDATNRIDAALTALLEQDRQHRAADSTSNEPIPEVMPSETCLGSTMDVAIEPPASDDAANDVPALPVMQAQYASSVPAARAETPGEIRINPDLFFDETYTPTLSALMANVVNTEGPLPEAILARRISQEHGWQRTGARIQARVASLLHLFDLSTEDQVQFVWPYGKKADRHPYRGVSGRTIRDISRTEIAWVEDQNASRITSSEDPIQELARLLGIARLTQDTRSYLQGCREWRNETGATP